MAIAKDDRQKALDAALSQIEKQFGKGAVMKLGDPAALWDWEEFPRAGSLRSTDLNPPVRRPSHCI